MGNAVAKLSLDLVHKKHPKHPVTAWVKAVDGRLTDHDIDKYRKIWYGICGDGEMDRKAFRVWLKTIGMISEDTDDEHTPIEHLFRSYDIDGDGTISFADFILYLSIISPTQVEEDPFKIVEITFKIYDEDGDGHITKQEMVSAMKANLTLAGKDPESEEVKHFIDDQVEKIFRIADRDHHEDVTLQNIKDSLSQHPELLSML